jgi:hypothetical protein
MAEQHSNLTLFERLTLATVVMLMSPFTVSIILTCGFLLSALASLLVLLVPFVILVADVIVDVEDDKLNE